MNGDPDVDVSKGPSLQRPNELRPRHRRACREEGGPVRFSPTPIATIAAGSGICVDPRSRRTVLTSSSGRRTTSPRALRRAQPGARGRGDTRARWRRGARNRPWPSPSGRPSDVVGPPIPFAVDAGGTTGRAPDWSAPGRPSVGALRPLGPIRRSAGRARLSAGPS